MKNRREFLKIGLGIFLILALLGFVFFKDLTKDLAASAPSTPDPLILNRFHSIQGTSILVAMVERENQRVGDLSARWFNFGYGYAVSNMVFLDGRTLSSHTLFRDNSYSIIGVYQFPTPNLDSYRDADEIEVKWLVYEVIKSDTNDDGEINNGDESTVAVSDVDGNNYTEVLVHATQIYGTELIDDDTLVLVFEREVIDGEGNHGTVAYAVAKIDLREKKVIEISDLTKIQLEDVP